MTEFIVTTTDRGIGVIAPKGRLNLVSAKQLTETISTVLASGTTKVVVDLAACDFMDSSGLGALIAGLKSARQAGGDLRLARPTDQILTVLSLTNLDRVLRPRDTVEGAFDVV